MREVELKAVLDSWESRRARLLTREQCPCSRGASKTVATIRWTVRSCPRPRAPAALYRNADGARAELEFKGATSYERGYKVREEIGSTVSDPEAIALVLAGLGYIVMRAIDRDIEQFEVNETIVRFERYPRMDDLVEVEGEPDALERAIATLGLPREEFTAERLTDFAARYEARTGKRAALADGELSGNASPVRER